MSFMKYSVPEKKTGKSRTVADEKNEPIFIPLKENCNKFTIIHAPIYGHCDGNLHV